MAPCFPADTSGIIHYYQCKYCRQRKVCTAYSGGYSDRGGKCADSSTMGRGHAAAANQSFRQKYSGMGKGEQKFNELRQKPCQNRCRHTGIACS